MYGLKTKTNITLIENNFNYKTKIPTVANESQIRGTDAICKSTVYLTQTVSNPAKHLQLFALLPERSASLE